MRPELLPVGLLVQFGDPDAVLVGGNVFRHDVHSDFGQIQVRADSRRGGDSGIGEHLPDQLHREIMGGEFVKFQIRGRVDEHLVDGIDVDVVRRDVFQVNAVDLRADLDVTGHARHGDDVVQFQGRVRRQFRGAHGLAAESVSRRDALPLGVDLPDLLHHFEQARPSGDAAGFQRRGNRETDRLVRPGLVGNHKIGRERIELPVGTLRRGVKGLQVNGYVDARCHWFSTLANGHIVKSISSPERYFSSRDLERTANLRRTSRRSPLILAMDILSYAVV